MRPIDADALREKIEAEWFDGYPMDIFREYVNTAPTIEPKRGKWKHDADGLVWCYGCGFGKERSDERPYNFCPNCGAAMERSEE